MSDPAAASGDLAGKPVRIERLVHAYGDQRVLDEIDAAIPAGEFLTLLGASGSGKTTLLRIIAGLVAPKSGRILIDGRDVTRLAPERRDIGFVFQNYALFPHLTVADNVAFALKVRRIGRPETERRVADALERVGLRAFADRYPGQISGGQQQRVALARALVFRPGMLLLDEPLGALDRHLRQQLAVELRNLQRRTGLTMIYVTHDQEEAFTMSTTVAVMQAGRIRQMAAPADLYRRPESLMVASFVGELNVLPGVVREADPSGTLVETASGPLRSTVTGFAPGGRVICAIRPEHLSLETGSGAGANRLPVRLETVIFGGSWHRLDYLLASGEELRAEGRGEPPGLSAGDAATVSCTPDHVLLFHNED